MRLFTAASAVVCLFGVAVAARAENAVPDLPNYHQVDDRIYRGGQPSLAGIVDLSKRGIKTVIDLRPNGDEGSHSIKKEGDAVESAGMRYVSIPLSGVSAPSNESVAKILSVVTGESQPVFIHCRRGADRTGLIVACYRIQHDHWKSTDALQEAIKFGMSWLEFGMKRFVVNFRPDALPLQSTPAFSPPSAAAAP